MKFLKKFKTDAHGAVTVDWVVLVAVIVGLALLLMNAFGGSSDSP